MIYEAEISNIPSQRTVGYNKPIIELTDRRAYTMPIPGDIIRIGFFICVILYLEQTYSDKFHCKLLCLNRHKTPEVISFKIMTTYLFTKNQPNPKQLFKTVLKPGDLIQYLPLQKLYFILSFRQLDGERSYGYFWLVKILTSENKIVQVSFHEAEIQQVANVT